MTNFAVGDSVLYGSEGVCRIEEIGERDFMGTPALYYTLRPVYAQGSVVFVPAANEALMAKMRRILSAEEIYALIRSMPEGGMAWIEDDGERRNRFAEILQEGDRGELVSMLRALYRHREIRVAQGRKLHAADERFMRDGERVLHEEFAHVLHIDRSEVGPFITERLNVEARI